METLGQRIRKKRLELHLSQEELAKRLGYKSRSSINKIELGLNDITQSKVAEFAYALGVSVAYLMGWDDHEGNTITLQIGKDFDTSTWKLSDEQTLDIIELLKKFELENEDKQ